MKTIYCDKDSEAKYIAADFTDWLTGGANTASQIASVTWKVAENDSRLTLSNASNTGTVAVNYVNVTGHNQQTFLKCTIVTTDAIPETESRSFLIKGDRT